MNIKLNGQTKVIDEGSTLQHLIVQELSALEGIAVARNMKVVKRTEWTETMLQEGDELVVIVATKGG